MNNMETTRLQMIRPFPEAGCSKCAAIGRDPFPRLPDQIEVVHQIAKAEWGQTALLLAQQFARPAQFQVRLGDAESVRRLLQNFQALPRLLGFRVGNQDAISDSCAPTPDASAQLMQLRQTEPFRVFDEHDGRVRHIHPYLD